VHEVLERNLIDLGINAIWLSPFCQTNDYHGYHVTDFYKIEPRFGTLDDLKELIEKAHRSGIKIIADFEKNLQKETSYLVRAYATNKIGTSYGNTIEFKSHLRYQAG